MKGKITYDILIQTTVSEIEMPKNYNTLSE